MEEMKALNKQKWYPWLLCLVCLLLNFIVVGMTTTAFSTYLPFLRESIGMTYTQTSMINTIRCLTSAVCMPFTTMLYKKLSIRVGVAASCLITALSCIMYATASSVWMCYLAAVVMGMVFAFGNAIPIALLIRGWFNSKSGTALSIALTGSSVATTVMPPVITYLVQTYGIAGAFYRECLLIIAGAVIVFLVIRDTPAHMGLQPYQSAEAQSEKAVHKVNRKDMSQKAFYLFLFAMLLVGISGAPYTSHLALHLRTLGIDPMITAAGISVFGGTMAVGKIVLGMACDRFGAYKVNYLFISMLIVGSFMLSRLRADSGRGLYLAAAIAGVGLAVGTVGITIWCRDLSDESQFANRVKLSQTMFMVGGLVGSPVPGIIADRTGSYGLAYAFFAVCILVVMIIVQTLYIRSAVR